MILLQKLSYISMEDTIFEAHKDFLRETLLRLMNRGVAGPFWFDRENRDVQISGCYSYPKPVLLKRSDLLTEEKDSILDIKEITFDEQKVMMIFWKYGWFGYTTTLHPLSTVED